MRSNTSIRKAVCLGGVLLWQVWVVGCAAPPSVTPLLRVTERALHEESARLTQDAEAERERGKETLRSLADGFDRDLEQTQALTPEWVKDATAVYVAAREAVQRNQDAVAHDHMTRAENLAAAASATRRAIGLLEGRDRLLAGLMDDRLRDWLDLNTQIGTEATR